MIWTCLGTCTCVQKRQLHISNGLILNCKAYIDWGDLSYCLPHTMLGDWHSAYQGKVRWGWRGYFCSVTCTSTSFLNEPSSPIHRTDMWRHCVGVCRKKIEEIGKMTALSQEEIVSNTKTVMQGLDTLKNEHHQILNSLLSSMKTIKKENGDTNLVEEKTHILQKALETIDLGLSEAQVRTLMGLFSLHLIIPLSSRNVSSV